jgi:hypothetical protein
MKALRASNKTITDANEMDKTKDLKNTPFGHKTKRFQKGAMKTTV